MGSLVGFEECVLYSLTFIIGAIFGAFLYHSDKEFDLKVYNSTLKLENKQLRERIKICEEKSRDLMEFNIKECLKEKKVSE